MLDTIAKILEKYTCNSCLGRSFAQLLSGYSNEERGKTLRTALAMEIDSGKEFELEPSNFYGFKFRNNEEFAKKIKQPGKCWVCNNLFENLDKIAVKVKNKVKVEFKTFLVGSRPSKNLIEKEEELWEKVGIDWCEPLKAEINREIGKRLEKILKAKVDLKKPDIVILIDLENFGISIKVNPLYIFGYYKKLVRGIPQCKWGTPKKYRTSVEQIIAKPIISATKGKNYKLHGAGREDISARCLAWRAFVLEILEPKKRAVDLKKITKQIKGKVVVKSLKYADMATVRKIKSAKPDKTYKVIVQLEKAVDKKDLKKLKMLIGTIQQRTPSRVVHRRADMLRKREIKTIGWKRVSKKEIEMKIKAAAGLYIKELISGDNGRTKPSIAELLGCKAECKELDVIGIEKIKI